MVITNIKRIFAEKNDNNSQIYLKQKDICSKGCINETFRVLKDNEIRQYGEYRTKRLVLEAWNKFGFDNKKRTNAMAENNTNIQIRIDFNQIFGIINYHRQRVSKTVDDESLRMIWEVGAYVSNKLKTSEWGSYVVRQLSEYIRTQDPTIKGWSYRTIYKMVQFYETYSSESFKELMQSTKLTQFTKMELPSAATG